MTLQTNKLFGFARRTVATLPSPVADALRSAKRFVLNTRSREKVFERIARDNGWDGTESVSGPGSTLEATAMLRDALPTLLEKYKIRSILDIPCGDAYWISYVLNPNIEYIGADIVPGIIARNRIDKASIGHFEVMDIVADNLQRVDLVLVRDCFIHLPNAVVRSAIANIKRSGARYLMTTTYPGKSANMDIEIGGFRPVDLQASPFRLPAPLEMILETEGIASGKSMGLWKVDKL